MSNWRRHRAFIGEKVPEHGPFHQFWRGVGHLCSAQGQISKRNHTPMNYKYCLVCACKGMTWGPSAAQRCHPRSQNVDQGWVCRWTTIYTSSRCMHRHASVCSLAHPNLAARQGWKLRVPINRQCFKVVHAQLQLAPLSSMHELTKLTGHQLWRIFVVHQLVLASLSGPRHRAFIGEKVPENGPFSGPVLEGRGASGSAQGQISKRNHTPMNYKYCTSLCMQRHDFATAVKGATPDQRRATGRSLAKKYLSIYTVQGLRRGVVCIWLRSNLCTNLKLRMHHTNRWTTNIV